MDLVKKYVVQVLVKYIKDTDDWKEKLLAGIKNCKELDAVEKDYLIELVGKYNIIHGEVDQQHGDEFIKELLNEVIERAVQGDDNAKKGFENWSLDDVSSEDQQLLNAAAKLVEVVEEAQKELGQGAPDVVDLFRNSFILAPCCK